MYNNLLQNFVGLLTGNCIMVHPCISRSFVATVPLAVWAAIPNLQDIAVNLQL
jgi:hypothetical protein